MPERIEIARQALLEITPMATVGSLLSDVSAGDGVATLRFEARMSGYPGWEWNVSLAEVEGEAPTVLEAELVPGAGALLAPDWVPWADRMEEWRAAQAAAAEAEAEASGVEGALEESEESDEDDELDDDELDDDDLEDDDLEEDDDDLDDDDDDFDEDDDDDLGDDVYDGVDIDSISDDSISGDADSEAETADDSESDPAAEATDSEDR